MNCSARFKSGHLIFLHFRTVIVWHDALGLQREGKVVGISAPSVNILMNGLLIMLL